MECLPLKLRLFKLLVALFTILIPGIGCGKIGPPLPPLEAPPPSLGSVQLSRTGNLLEFQFEVVGGTAKTATIQQRCRQSGLEPEFLAEFPEEDWFQPQKGATQILRFRKTQPLDACAYTLTIIDKKNKSSNPYGPIRDPGLQAANPPTKLEAQVKEDQIYLQWEAPLENVDGSRPANLVGYLVNSEHFTENNFYQDQQFSFSTEKSFRVQAVTFQSVEMSILSEFSPDIHVLPIDRFPPRPPQNVSLVRLVNRVQVIWDQNKEVDLSGYYVYREPAPVSGDRISDLLTLNSYTDSNVVGGRSYTYRVTAVDRAGNESPPSREAEIRIP